MLKLFSVLFFYATYSISMKLIFMIMKNKVNILLAEKVRIKYN